MLRQFFFLLKNIRTVEAIFVMFGGHWSLLPSVVGRIFGIPVFIILGGTECVSFPSINYGSLRKPLLREVIRLSFRFSSTLLPVDDSLVYQKYDYYSQDRNEQGYKSFFPGLSTPHVTIHNGFDVEFWQGSDVSKDKFSFITVAKIDNKSRFTLKGIDMILALAEHFQHWNFIIVGMPESKAVSYGHPAPSNVQCYDFLEPAVFRDLLASCQFYLQLSISEGFPNALAEAMLNQCIPIGSNVGGIPFIIGDTGLVIEKRDATFIRETVENFVQHNDAEQLKFLGEAARRRIVDNFDLSNREKALIQLLNSYHV